LRFTLSESEDFLNRIMGLNLPKEQIFAMESRIEGWIAGLHLAAVSIQGDSDADRIIQSFTGSHYFVLDYLVEEVLQRQPEAMQSFLLKTSILDRLCGPLCDDIMRDSGGSGGETLMELERRNLFIVPLDHERRWYRYHHLFADSLRKRLQDRLGRDDIAQLHKRASAWHENEGLEMEAFRHAVEARDTDRAARLLEGKGLPLHLRGGAGLSLNWLASLPATELDDRPALWAIYGSALLMTGKLAGVEHKLQAAEAALANAVQDAGVRDWIGLIATTRATMASLALTGHPDGAERKLQAAEAVMQTTEADDKTDELVELIAPAGDYRMSESGQIEQVIDQSRRALAYLRPDNLPVRTAAAWMLGVACQRRGDHAAAREAYNEVISNSLMMDHRLMAVMAMIGLGQIEEAENRTSMAAECYQEALRMGGDLPFPALQEAQQGLARVHNKEMKGGLIEPLSPREMEILELIAKGLSNKEIGEKLYLALDTVKGHNRRIFEKLNVQRRTEAIARAVELNLLPNNRKPH